MIKAYDSHLKTSTRNVNIGTWKSQFNAWLFVGATHFHPYKLGTSGLTILVEIFKNANQKEQLQAELLSTLSRITYTPFIYLIRWMVDGFLDAVSERWREIPINVGRTGPPCARRRHASVIVEDRLFVFGGTSPSKPSEGVIGKMPNDEVRAF